MTEEEKKAALLKAQQDAEAKKALEEGDEIEELLTTQEKKVLKQKHDDMVKAKARAKQAEQELAKLLKEKEAVEQEKLEQAGEWKRLYEKEQADKKKLTETIQSSEKKFKESIKRQAVIEAVGGFKRPEYANFINLDNVMLDENNNVIAETLSAEADRIKQDFSDLIKTTTVVPDSAAAKFVNRGDKEYDTMTAEEKRAAQKNALAEARKKHLS